MARAFALFTSFLAAAVVGCGSSQTSAPGNATDGGGSAVRLSAGGATFVDPIMQAWAGDYKKVKGTEIDYLKSGSGKGITDLTARQIDFGCS
ncbi:MAG: substrate-binding domain-containing protein, partial [Fimbriiglobus sp.]